MISALALLFVLSGILVPSSTLIESLRPLPADSVQRSQLLLGAGFFRIGLIAIGVAIFWIHRWSQRYPATKQKSDDHRQRRANWIFFALLLLSAGLRIYKLNEGLWLDEIGMYLKYIRLPLGEILTTYDSENQHFLYTILADLACSSFGTASWSLRLPAVLFGLGSLVALFLLGREVSNPSEATLAVGLLSLSYYHIWFSQNARGYTGLLFWTLLSSWLFLRALKESQPRSWILYACSVALGMYTQFTMLFVVFSQLVIFLFKAVREKRNFRWSGLTLGFLLSGLLTFQLYALVLPQFSGTIGMKGTVPEWDSPLWTLTELSRGMRLSFQGSLAAVCAAIIFGLGFVNYLRTKPELPALFLLASGIGTAVVLVMRHPLWPRFYFFAVGFAALIAIRGAIVLAKPMAKSSMPGIVLCVAIILVSALAIPSAYRPKQDFLGAQDFVQTNRESDDSVVTIGRATLPYQGFYNANWSTAESLDELEEIRAKSERTWVVYMLPEDLENTHPDLMLRLHSDFKTVRQFEGSLAGGTIYVSVSSPHKIKDGSGQQIQQHQ